MKTIGAKVEDEIYAVFNLVCEKDGVTVSDRLKDLVNKFVKEEAPYLVLDEKTYLELKRIAEEKGQDWKKMVCDSILAFCKKCSEEKEAKTETEKEEEGKEEVEIKIVRESELEKKEKPKPKFRIIERDDL